MEELICNLYQDYYKLPQMSDAGKQFIENYFTEQKAVEVLKLDIDPEN